MFFFNLIAYRFYFSFQVGGDAAHQSIKQIENFHKGDLVIDYPSGYRLDFGLSPLSPYKFYFSPAFKMGKCYYETQNWTFLFEANFHLFNLSGFSSELGLIMAHRIGIFFGIGFESALHWSIPQTLTEVDRTKKLCKTSTAALKAISGSIASVLHFGYHLKLKENMALRFEIETLISSQDSVNRYSIYLPGEKYPLSQKVKISYTPPYKLRLSAGLTVYVF